MFARYKVNVLLIHDDPALIHRVRAILAHFSALPESSDVLFRVLNCSEPKDAVEMSRALRFDAVVVDLGLPGSDLSEVERALHQFSGQLGSLFVLRGREALSEEFLHSFRIGAVEYLEHPINAMQLCTRLLDVCRRNKNRSGWLQALFDHALNGILLATDEGYYVEANAAACNMLGYERGELFEKHFSDLVEVDGLGESRQQWATFLTEGRGTGRTRLKKKNGELLVAEFSAVANVLPGLHLSILSDVTERQKAEDALAKSEETLRLALAISDLGVWRLHLKTNEFFWDRRTIEMFTLDHVPTVEEFLGLVLLEDLPAVRAAFQAMRDGQPEVTSEFRTVKGDGQILHAAMKCQVQKNTQGEPEWVMGVTADITAMATATAALRSSRERLARTFDAVAEGVIVQDLEGRIVEFNKGAERILGLSLTGVDHLNLTDLQWKVVRENGEPFSAEDYPSRIARATGESVRDVILGLIRPDGSQFWVSVNCVPTRDSQGLVSFVVSSFSDITERRRIERELIKSRKFRALGEIVGGVAHEFNNLLQPMLLRLGEIGQDPDTPRSVMAQLEPVESAVHAAVELCQRVLSMGRTRVEAEQETSLNQLVESTVGLILTSIDPRIRVELDLHPDSPKVFVAGSQISQVIVNLCMNARDTLLQKLEGRVPPGWQPSLKIATGQRLIPLPSRGDGALHSQREMAVIEISDNGMGMSEEIRSHIFEPFFTTKPATHGTGLGLAVIWNIVDSNNGWIHVDSTPGNGTHFAVFLPASTRTNIPIVEPPLQPEPEPTLSASSPSRRGDPFRILLVEDHELVSKAIISILSRDGYQVDRVSNGELAWKVLLEKKHSYELIISDLMMPRINGLELARLIRQIPFKGRIIIISGYVSKAQQTDLLAHGVHRILLKPVKPEDLLDCVANARNLGSS